MRPLREAAADADESMLTHGAAPFIAKLVPMLTPVVTVHHGHMPEIEVHSSTSASGVWAMEDKLWVGSSSSLPFRWLDHVSTCCARSEQMAIRFANRAG